MQAAKKLCNMYHDEALKERQSRNWFEKCSGRPVELNEDETKTIIEADRHVTSREVAEKLNISHTVNARPHIVFGHTAKIDEDWLGINVTLTI